jgi:hypothetical protein
MLHKDATITKFNAAFLGECQKAKISSKPEILSLSKKSEINAPGEDPLF